MNNAFMEFFNDEFICGSQKSGQDDDPSIKSAYKTLFKKILNCLPEGIWIYNAEGKVVMINHAAEWLEGIEAKEMLGKTHHEIYKKGIFDCMVAPEVFKSKKEVSLLSYTRRTKKRLLITGNPILDNNGDVYLVVNTLRDVTKLSRIQEKLKETQEVTRKIKDELTELNLLELKGKEIIAESDSMKQVLNVAIKFASIEVRTILITGETGVGKGILSKFIHINSNRKGETFVQINCAALPENLLEAELFGYEPGAFTGASKDGKIGLLELADKGTLFLDEIGELPFSIQAKLLKFLEDHEIMRLGGVRRKKVDCIIIAATNRELKEMIKRKKFRRDLYYRLEAFTIHIPPLRKRPEDIFELAKYYLEKYNKRYNKKAKISSKTMLKLTANDLPGNSRQLKNIFNMAVALSDEDDIDQLILQKAELSSDDRLDSILNGGKERSLKERMLEAENKILKDAKTKYKSIRAIANHLKLSKSSADRKLKKHGLS